MSSWKWYLKGMRDGIPIMLGYFAVSIALGIAARNAGLSALQAALASLTNNASAGEYVGFTLIAAGASYTEMFVMEAVANARYLLMSTALSQRLSASVSLVQRLLLGFMVTDEIFGVSISVEGHVRPVYPYGLFTVATLGWTVGTFLGVVLGNVLPLRVVRALLRKPPTRRRSLPDSFPATDYRTGNSSLPVLFLFCSEMDRKDAFHRFFPLKSVFVFLSAVRSIRPCAWRGWR